MSLRSKILIAWGITVIALIAVLYTTLANILDRQRIELESGSMRAEVARFDHLLRNELDALRATALDWSRWDDSYEFMASNSRDYIESNLAPQTLDILRLDAMVYLTLDGRILWGSGRDRTGGTLTPLPAGLPPMLPALAQRALTTDNLPHEGLAILPEGPALLSAAPILDSQGNGPARGSLIMLRFLAPSDQENLGRIVNSDIMIQPFDPQDPLLSQEVRQTLLSAPGAVAVQPFDDRIIEGYRVFEDLFGQPTVLLRIAAARPVYQATQRTLELIFAALLFTSAVFSALLVFFLERFVLTRLYALHTAVLAIGAGETRTSAPLAIPGADELSRLGTAIGSMLTRLAALHQARMDSEARFRSIVEHSFDAILLVEGANGRIIEANPQAVRLLNGAQAGLTGLTLYDILTDDRRLIESCLTQALANGFHRVVATARGRNDVGQPTRATTPRESPAAHNAYATIPVELAATRLLIEHRPALSIAIHDFTERRRAELAEQAQRAFLEGLRDASTALNSTLDFEELLDRIVENVAKVLPHDTCEILLLEQDMAHVARTRGYHNPQDEVFVIGIRLKVTETPNLHTMTATRRPLVISDVWNDVAWVRLPRLEWIRSFAGAPILCQEQVVGFLHLCSATPAAFQQSDAERLQAFADQAGLAIGNARLYEASQRQTARAEALLRVARQMHRHFDTASLLQMVAAETAQALHADTVMVHLVDAQQGVAVCAAAYGLAAAQVARIPPLPLQVFDDLTPAPAGALQTASGQFLPIELLCAECRRHFGPAMAYTLPLRLDGELLGAITAFSANPAWLTQQQGDALDEGLAQGIANQAVLALEAARLLETVQRHAAELEERVVERTRELSEANLKLRELDAMKNQFVSNVSHELRTPLTNIKLYLQLLETGRADRQAQYMATLHRETNLLRRLIEDLLQLSRLDLKAAAPNLSAIDVNRTLRVLTHDREPLIAERGLTLRLAADDAPLTALADERLLIQMLTTLMTNAMNYTPAGGVLTVWSRRAHDDGQDWIMLAVSDTGPGIPADEQLRIFDRFYCGRVGLESASPGTGLGLAICQEIAHLHRGRLTLESQLGHGSTFVIWLHPADDHDDGARHDR